jgi:hypothetical protein
MIYCVSEVYDTHPKKHISRSHDLMKKFCVAAAADSDGKQLLIALSCLHTLPPFEQQKHR